jgi:hypothetical protein
MSLLSAAEGPAISRTYLHPAVGALHPAVGGAGRATSRRLVGVRAPSGHRAPAHRRQL